MKRHHCLWVIFLGILEVYGQDVIYRMCVTERRATTNDCNILKRTGSRVNCVMVTDSTDCALKLERNEADFGIFTAEEAILTSKFDTKQERRVVGDIRSLERRYANFEFETVAIVKGNFSGPLSNLKGTNFCHPGFSKSQFWTDRVLKHFERIVLNKTVACDRSLRSAAEDELYALSTFFSKACRPGQWVPHDRLDTRFKQQQFPNLCALCDSQTGCSYNPQAEGNQYSTLSCLTNRGGDVAYVAFYYAQRYFGLLSPFPRLANPNGYNYLCPNGTTQNVTLTINPCKWIQQPWSSVVARNNEIARSLRVNLQVWVPTEQHLRRSNDWMDTLTQIMLGRTDTLVLQNDTDDLKSFIEKGREIPQAGTTLPCRGPIKWCTTSEMENGKCEWLSAAGVTQGIVPEIQCVQTTSQVNCLQKVKDGEADLVGIDTNLGPIASHFYNLTTSVYQETEREGLFRIVAIVRSDLTASSLLELRDTNSCFPEFGGLAWTAFVEAIRNSSKSDINVCPYDDSMATFFTSACAPGAVDRLKTGENDGRNLCELCNKTSTGVVPFSTEDACAATTRNQFYGDAGALRCLGSGFADVAILNFYNFSKYLDDSTLPQDFSERYKIMCRNGTKFPLTTVLDDGCAIAVVTGGEIVARGSRSKIESRDLGFTLLELDEWFGYINSHHDSIFKLFEPFNETKDLLFRNEALGFITRSNDDEDPNIQTYSDLKTNAEKCSHSKTNGAPGVLGRQSLLIFMIIATTIKTFL